MIRAQFKNKAYFDELVRFSQSSTERYLNELTTDNTLTNEIKMNFSRQIVSNFLELLELKYSRGDAITGMVNDVKQVLHFRQLQKEFADQLSPDTQQNRIQWETLYGDMTDLYQWLLFALATGMDNHYFSQALTLVANQGRDRLFDLIAIRLGDTQRPVAEQLLWKKGYRELIKVIDCPPEKQAKAMNLYLDHWYVLSEQNDLHLHSEEGYSGYWCYEAALVTRLWQLDDSGWREHPYYPKDLVR